MGINRVGSLTGITFMLALSLPAAAATITVAAGGNLQAAIDNAAAGDTILLQAGATFIGNFVVRSGQALDHHPVVGRRYAPARRRAAHRARVLGVPAKAAVAE